MGEWTKKELELYRRIVCSEQIGTSCEGCTMSEEDIDNCCQELINEIVAPERISAQSVRAGSVRELL